MRLNTGYHPHSGFTLIELMVAIVVFVIVAQISLWFFADFLAKNRADNQISLLPRHINFARLKQCSEGEWHTGVSLFIDNDRSTSLDDDELLISTFEYTHNADTLEYPRTAITFRPDGSLNGFQNGTFVYCPNTDKASLEGLALSISQTGRIRIKSTNKCQQ